MCDQSQFNISNIPQSCYYYLNFFKCIFLKILVFTKLLSEQHKVFFFFCLWQSTLCMFLFSRRIQFHFLHHATHHARSMPLCSTVATLLCGGNDCRCAWKPLVGMRRCKQETNKHYVFQSDWRVCYTPWSASLQIPPAPPLPRQNHIIIFRDLFINICKCKKRQKKKRRITVSHWRVLLAV